MSRAEPELWAMLRQASDLDHGEAQQALMEDVVRHADAGGFPRLAFTARRALANAYSVDRQWHKAFPLFSRCLSEYDQRAWDFGPEDEYQLRRWYTNIAQSMAEFPEISLEQIYAAFTDMERRFTTGGHSLRAVHDARRWVAQVVGDWDEEERCHRAWIAAGGPNPNSVWDFEAEVERLVLRGDDASVARALELAEPVLAGQRTFDEPPAPIQCHMLLPLVRAGRAEDAALAYRRSTRTMEYGVYRYEYSGMHVEFCALTGNDVEGLEQLQRRLKAFFSLNRPNGKMEFATSSAVLLRMLMENGRGQDRIKRGYGQDEMTTVAELHAELDGIARDLAQKFDARNGSTSQGDRVRARLAARPVRDFLPLTPTSRPRADLRPPAGTPPEQMLDRAEWHLRASEITMASAALAALPEPVPPHLTARAAEARAVVRDDKESGKELRWAAEEHRRAGDHRRRLMCLAQLGQWQADIESSAEGPVTAGGAVEEMRAAGDTWALAWGELWLGRALWSRRKRPEAFAAFGRAGQAAVTSGDPLAVGVVALEHAFCLGKDDGDPGERIRLAAMACDALIAAGASALVWTMLKTLRSAHEQAGALPAYVAMVRDRLNRLPERAHPVARGELRYEHGRALLAEGRPAEAVPVLTDALADLAPYDRDRATEWYDLAVACHQTERYEDAVHAADTAVHWLYNLRKKDRLDDPDMADNCRMLLATAHRKLGEDDAALENFAAAIDAAHESGHRSMLPFALTEAGEVLSEQGRHDQAAPRFAEAVEAHQAIGDPFTAVHSRCAEAMAWFRTDENDRAQAAFGAAEQAARALPPDPRQALAWADVGRVGAIIMAGLGRGPDAVRHASQAATAFRHAGRPDNAVGMDVLHARILLGDGRPDLVRQLADSLAQQGHAEAAEAVRAEANG